MYYIFDEETGKWEPSRTEKVREVALDSEKTELQLLMIVPAAERLSVDFRATYMKVERIAGEFVGRQVYYESVFDMRNHEVVENPLERSQFVTLEAAECFVPVEVLAILKNVLELLSSGVYGMRLGFAPSSLSDIENYVRNPLRRIAGDENKIQNTKINYLDPTPLDWRETVREYEFVLPRNTDEIYFFSDWLSMFRKEEGRDYLVEVLRNDIVLMFVKKGGSVVAGLELHGTKIVQVAGPYKNWFYGGKDKYNDLCVNVKRWAGRHGLKVADDDFGRK